MISVSRRNLNNNLISTFAHDLQAARTASSKILRYTVWRAATLTTKDRQSLWRFASRLLSQRHDLHNVSETVQAAGRTIQSNVRHELMCDARRWCRHRCKVYTKTKVIIVTPSRMTTSSPNFVTEIVLPPKILHAFRPLPMRSPPVFKSDPSPTSSLHFHWHLVSSRSTRRIYTYLQPYKYLEVYRISFTYAFSCKNPLSNYTLAILNSNESVKSN